MFYWSWSKIYTYSCDSTHLKLAEVQTRVLLACTFLRDCFQHYAYEQCKLFWFIFMNLTHQHSGRHTVNPLKSVQALVGAASYRWCVVIFFLHTLACLLSFFTLPIPVNHVVASCWFCRNAHFSAVYHSCFFFQFFWLDWHTVDPIFPFTLPFTQIILTSFPDSMQCLSWKC